MSNNIHEFSDVFPITFLPIVVEGGDAPVKWKGTFGWADKPTSNKRNYSRKLWERLASDDDVNRRLKGGMIGVMNHPENGETDLVRSTIMTKKITVKESGEIEGEAIILPTACGVLLKQLIESGATLGVSTRGRGTVDEEGNVNEDNYQLITFDVVDNPAVSSATPKIAENINGNNTINNNPGGGFMESVVTKYSEIEKNVNPTLVAIEEGKFSPEIRNALDELLVAASFKVAAINEDGKGLFTPMVADLQNRIIEARNKLRKNPVVKEAVEPVKPEPIKTVTLDNVKIEDPAKTTTENVDEIEAAKKLNEAHVAELEKTIEVLEGKLKEALWAVEEIKQIRETDAVKEAIEDEIKKCPVLEESRFILEKANTVEELSKFVGRLNAATTKPTVKTEDDDAPNKKLPPAKTDNTKTVVEGKDKPPRKTPTMHGVYSQIHDINVGLRK